MVGLATLVTQLTVCAQTTATAVATVVNGFVVAVNVTEGGSGYASPPLVTIAGGGGHGAAATATVGTNGAIARITVNNAGADYASTPTVTIAPPSVVPTGSQGQVAYYPFHGNARDESGNANDGLPVGAQLATDRFGKTNSCYAFNGVSDYLVIPDSPNLEMDGAITVSAWFYLNELPHDPPNTYGVSGYGIAVKGPDAEAELDWALVVVYDRLRSHLSVGGRWLYFDSKTVVAPKSWQHVMMTYDGVKMTCYLNGEYSGQLNAPGTLNFSHEPVRLGAYAPLHGTASKYFLDGKIDDVRIFNRAFSSEEAFELFLNESVHYASLGVQVRQIRIQMTLKPGMTYQLESSDTQSDWSPYGLPFVAPASQLFQDIDVTAGPRFFRLREVNP